MTLPPVPETFHWTHEPWGPALRCVPLDAVAPHLFTTRYLHLPSEEGLAHLARSVGVASHSLVTVNQVHGRDVLVIRRGASAEARAERDGVRPDADALVSDDPDAALAVRAADCAPILLADTVTGAVAAVHAGWRGTAAGAAVAGVEALHREFGAQAADLVVVIGPTIGACCYDVGTDVVDAFAAAGHERYLIDRWFAAPPGPRGTVGRARITLDVAGANRDQLILAGVPEERVHVAGLCTAMHLDVLTSYRAEKAKATRLAAVIRAASR